MATETVTVVGSAGTLISIGTKAADETSDSYTLIGEVSNWPEFGPNYEVVQHTRIANRTTSKLKGAENFGRLDLTVALDFGDAGQQACRTAYDDVSKTSGDYNFKVVLPDDAGGTGDTPTIIYIRGGVFAFTVAVDNVNAVLTGNLGIEINDLEIIPAVDAA